MVSRRHCVPSAFYFLVCTARIFRVACVQMFLGVGLLETPVKELCCKWHILILLKPFFRKCSNGKLYGSCVIKVIIFYHI